MKLSDKILQLRKQRGMSQEDLAAKLNVSRQAISHWETGSAQPYASNILQLSKLFGVSADYLLNDDYQEEQAASAQEGSQAPPPHKAKKIIALCVSAFGLLGNFIIYVLSRFIRVMVPHIFYQDGKKWYRFSSDLTGYSYKYFIQKYHLEFLTIMFWALFAVGLLAAFVNREKIARAAARLKCPHVLAGAGTRLNQAPDPQTEEGSPQHTEKTNRTAHTDEC